MIQIHAFGPKMLGIALCRASLPRAAHIYQRASWLCHYSITRTLLKDAPTDHGKAALLQRPKLKSQESGVTTASAPPKGKSADILLSEKVVTATEQRKADWAIIKQMTKYLWPKDSLNTKVRVSLAVGLLIGAKVLNVQIPFYFKNIVDGMNIDFVAIGGTAWTVAGSIIIAYGATRVGATLFQELRNAIFASVAQKAIRRVAGSVYEHLLKLDLNFHLSRQTGGLTRAIDRGTKGISFLLTSMVFHVIPTALEIGLVCGILVSVPSRYDNDADF
jgi:ATP-binding cassette, subfamily B (MDR/TAP), member 7